MKFLITLATLALSLNSFAAELNGVKMNDEIEVGGKKLVLNGLGTRKATFLKVKVYVGGLYLEAKSSNPEVILKSKTIKHLRMQYVRGVDSKKIENAFMESFEKSCGSHCNDLKGKMEVLAKAMPDMKDGELMEFTFYPDRVESTVKGNKGVVITDAAFPEMFLSIWLGANPPNEDLKSGLLGK